MAIAILFDIVIFLGLVWFVSTQLIIPLVRGSRLFPTFSRPAHQIADEIAAVDQEIETEHARHILELKRQQLAKERDHGTQ